jgi:hypothetical protein
VLVRAHQCPSGLISAHQCSSACIGAHQAFHTCSTGMPAMIEVGSSSAAELMVSFAPTTSATSVLGKSSLISSISST